MIGHACLTNSCRHPFDSSKWGRVRNFLEGAGILHNDRIVEPLDASEDDLLVVRNKQLLSTSFAVICSSVLYGAVYCVNLWFVA